MTHANKIFEALCPAGNIYVQSIKCPRKYVSADEMELNVKKWHSSLDSDVIHKVRFYFTFTLGKTSPALHLMVYVSSNKGKAGFWGIFSASNPDQIQFCIPLSPPNAQTLTAEFSLQPRCLWHRILLKLLISISGHFPRSPSKSCSNLTTSRLTLEEVTDKAMVSLLSEPFLALTAL